jgi:hypothetical protein
MIQRTIYQLAPVKIRLIKFTLLHGDETKRTIMKPGIVCFDMIKIAMLKPTGLIFSFDPPGRLNRLIRIGLVVNDMIGIRTRNGARVNWDILVHES